MDGPDGRWSRRLHFTKSGEARLAATLGWIVGLARGGRLPFAKSLAEDLVLSLDRLASYGGNVEPDRIAKGLAYGAATDAWLEVAERVALPRFRVVLDDDGTPGGFALSWYEGLVGYEVHEKRLAGEEFHEALTRLRVNESLDLSERVRNPKYEDGFDYVWVHYVYDWNGGLLYHGPGGGEVFAVDIGAAMGRNVLWSVHT